MTAVLVTGGAGFFGGILIQRLLDDGYTCVSLDLKPDWISHDRLVSITGDIGDRALLDELFDQYRFAAVFHCAAVLAHDGAADTLWKSNVEGTRAIADATAAHGVAKLIFISSNCLWGEGLHRPVTEEEPPRPVELYGRSKWEAEKIVTAHEDFEWIVLRPPTIIDSGRLGLLAILFDFIREGRRVWLVGRGTNRYQFIYAPDLAQACVLALHHSGSAVYNVGSDNVKTLRDIYQFVIDAAGTTARVRSLPKVPAVLAMRAANAAHLSPLGRYHWRMIAEDFVLDTSKIKAELGWAPTLTNEEMLLEAYKAYERDFDEIQARTNVSAHRQPAKMGAIRLLKWLS